MLRWTIGSTIRWRGASGDDAVTEVTAGFGVNALELARLLLLACLGMARGPRSGHQRSRPAGQLDRPRARRAGPVGFGDAGSMSAATATVREISFSGLYDPMTAGNVSPLLNTFETGAVTGSPCPMVDSFRVDVAREPRALKLLTELATLWGDDSDS